MTQRALSGATAELTRRALVSGNSADFDSMMRFVDAESVVDLEALGLGTHVGAPAIRRFFEDWIGNCDEFAVWPEEVVEIDEEVVVASVRQEARPAGSNSPLRLRYAAVYVWRGLRFARVVHYAHLAQARAAAEEIASAAHGD